MTLTAPIPVVPTTHPPIRIEARVYRTTTTLDGWRQLLAAARGRIEIGMMRRLDPTPLSIIDGDVEWMLTPAPGKPWVVLSGVWRQR